MDVLYFTSVRPQGISVVTQPVSRLASFIRFALKLAQSCFDPCDAFFQKSCTLRAHKIKNHSRRVVGSEVVVLCGHELLTRIIRFALILVSTLDPTSLT